MSKEKVLIGLSGGIDSTIAAYLLKQQGYDVYGLSIQTFKEYDDSKTEEIAKKLDIPLYIRNVEKTFSKEIIRHFIDTYQKGQTPNPCVLCNRLVKFQTLIDEADKYDIKYIATGHYANVKYNRREKRYVLRKGKDKRKDQSYMLYNLTQKQLSYSLFPLGNYTKRQVINLAKKIGINTRDIPESQDICFIPNGKYPEFIISNSNITDFPGDITDSEGNVIGQHKGITKYTIGQRKGILIPSDEPYFVIDIDIQHNRIIVGREKDIYSTALVATNLNFIAIEQLTKSLKVKAKIRYGAKETDAYITPMKNDEVKVQFRKKQRSITPGQAVVFYRRDNVIGGGIIKKKNYEKIK